jgi:hypothetical protein
LSIAEGNLPEVHVHVTFGRMRPFSDDVEDNCLARTGFRRGDDGRDVKNCTTSLTNFQSFFCVGVGVGVGVRLGFAFAFIVHAQGKHFQGKG